MGGRARRLLFGGAVLAGSLAVGVGPFAGGAGAEEVCTSQLGVGSDPIVCVASFPGVPILVLAASSSNSTLLVAGVECSPPRPSSKVFFGGALAGTPLTPLLVDTTLAC